MGLPESLAAWLPRQRWFAGKDAPITSLHIAAQTVLAEEEPGLRHLLVAVSQPNGTGRGPDSAGPDGPAFPGRGPDTYQVLVGLRARVPDRLAHAVIGPAGEGLTAYDALHDPELTSLLLSAMASQQTVGGLRFAREHDARIDPSLESLVLTAEQSNTSVLFGEDAILKFFRRPTPGTNPDLEVPRALTRLGSEHVAAPLGSIEGQLDGSSAVFAILSTYLRAAADGWSLAATSVRDLYATESAKAAQVGGDFAPEAHRLGEATAHVHRDLAEAFGVNELPALAFGELSAQMLARLDTALAVVPELSALAGKVRAAFADLTGLDGSLLVQRIHGDYHLGQVMRTQTGWVLLDFEGEPASTLAQRRARSPALRDVAGMLRSFDYAARHQLLGRDGGQRVRAAARDWVRRNRDAYCAGYAQAGGADPGKHATLLRALTFDKAVYEVMYEARHRPDWLPIPLESIADA